MNTSIHEKISDIYMTTMIQLDLRPMNQPQIMTRFTELFENLFYSEESKNILVAVCNVSRINYNLKMYDVLVIKCLNILCNKSDISIDDVILKCPERFKELF
jgi:hypothetical protein